ncbi:MAG: DUF502 domain-containing protein [Lutibacter sp.]|uniref:DUF502 domain-containing protein n=1 Tax=Lutibacter sp. TaxID=1925666 RepID=UPI00180640BA|nr:DUF502 domain-containing protein [Lutibacter sp.]MBT8316526.1 DUF502 domain-containing protein [Lutibacter sp.]NNJ57386.1 DUF502 domain-containing protein [Lutibacter sp.]
MKKLINYFLQGILYLAPLSITAYIIYSAFMFMDGLLQKYLEQFFEIKIPGLGFLTLVIFLIFIGFIGKTIIADPLKIIFQNIIKNIPLLNFVYTAIKDLFSAFVGKEKKFNKPVLVQMSGNSELEKLGFITEQNLEILNEIDKVAVYFPHSYNFSGELFIVPKTAIKKLDVNSSEMMKFIVSAGLTSWDSTKKTKV